MCGSYISADYIKTYPNQREGGLVPKIPDTRLQDNSGSGGYFQFLAKMNPKSENKHDVPSKILPKLIQIWSKKYAICPYMDIRDKFAPQLDQISAISIAFLK